MGINFERIYLGRPFELFEPAHIAALFITLLAAVCIWFFRKRFKGSLREGLRIFLAVFLLVIHGAWIVWLIWLGEASFVNLLPLNVCSLAVVLTVIMLFSKSFALFELTWFWGCAGGLAALLMPDVGFYRFPHFFFIQTMLSHMVLLLSQFYMAAAYNFRPTFRSFLKLVLFSQLLLISASTANWLFDSNYMFTQSRPEGKTLMDVLGPYPWYIIFTDLLSLTLSFLFYLPFVEWKKVKTFFTNLYGRLIKL